MSIQAASRTFLVAGYLVMFALSACTRVVETVPLEQSALSYGPTCNSPLGAYYLPKSLLKLKATAGDTAIKLDTFAKVSTADRTQLLCLDYLSSPVSDDVVRVTRSPNGLLEAVTSRVVDKTPDIFEKLVEIGANLAITAGRSSAVRSGETLEIEFDPFNWVEVSVAKAALRRFGICVYIEGYSFQVDGLTPAAIRKAGERWCSTGQPTQYESEALYYSSLPIPSQIMQTGILYRPNVSHRVVVLRKNDPDGLEGWSLFQTAQVDMPNVAPILSIGVDRALFATRETDLSFNSGVLTDVSINKTSELAGFVRIPLAVAKAVVAVPAQIIKFRIADATNQTALLNAQGQLANTLAQIRRDNAAQTDASAPRSSRTATFVGSCTNAGGDDETCARMAQRMQ